MPKSVAPKFMYKRNDWTLYMYSETNDELLAIGTINGFYAEMARAAMLEYFENHPEEFSS